MQIIKHPSPGEVIVEKTYSKEELHKIEQEILQAKCKELKIPGFRPGNAPLEKVRELLIMSRKWEELMGTKLQEAIIQEWSKEKNVELGEIVKVVDIKATKNEPLTLECHFEYFPRLKGTDIAEKYKSLKIDNKQKVQDIKISDKEIEEGLQELQKRRTILKPVAEALGKGKSAFIRIKHLAKGVEEKDAKEDRDLFQWGTEQYGKIFDEKTEGMKEGEEKVLNEEGEEKKVKVEKVFVSEAPEINDEFAKSLGKFHDLNDLKSNIKNGMILEKLYKELDTRRESLILALLNEIKIEVPDSIVKRNAAQYKQEFEQKVGKIGEAHDHGHGHDHDHDHNENHSESAKFDKIFEEKAKRELKLQRILEAIALKEKIVPSEDEVEKEIRKILQSFSKPKDAKNTLGDPEELRARVTLSLCFDKTLRFLEEKNDLTSDIDKELDKIEEEKHGHEHGHHHD